LLARKCKQHWRNYPITLFFQSRVLPLITSTKLCVLYHLYTTQGNLFPLRHYCGELFSNMTVGTPSTVESPLYSPYAFVSTHASHLFLSFASTMERFDVYKKHAKITLYPYLSSPFRAVTSCRTIEAFLKAKLDKTIGGISFNPDERETNFLTIDILYPSFFSLLLQAVAMDSFIVNIHELYASLPGIPPSKLLTSNALSAPFYVTSTSMTNPSDQQREEWWLPHLFLDKRPLEFQMFCLDLNEKAMAISASFAIPHGTNRTCSLKEILQESHNSDKSLLMWYDHDDHGAPIVIPSNRALYVLEVLTQADKLMYEWIGAKIKNHNE